MIRGVTVIGRRVVCSKLRPVYQASCPNILLARSFLLLRDNTNRQQKIDQQDALLPRLMLAKYTDSTESGQNNDQVNDPTRVPSDESVLEDEADVDTFDSLISVLTLKVRSMDDAVLKSYMKFMKSSARQLDLNVTNVVQLPRHIEKRTLLSSPFIFKKHHQQYEIRTYGRMLELSELTKESANIYLEYIQRNIPEGVSMSVEQTELEPLPPYFREEHT